MRGDCAPDKPSPRRIDPTKSSDKPQRAAEAIDYLKRWLLSPESAVESYEMREAVFNVIVDYEAHRPSAPAFRS